MQIDEHVRKAREAVAMFKNCNTETVEKVKAYDPKLRIWTMERVTTDKRAAEFAKQNKPKPKPLIKKKEGKKAPKKLPEKIFKPESARSRIYNAHISGMSNKEIARIFRIDSRRVSTEISKRKQQLKENQ